MPKRSTQKTTKKNTCTVSLGEEKLKSGRNIPANDKIRTRVCVAVVLQPNYSPSIETV